MYFVETQIRTNIQHAYFYILIFLAFREDSIKTAILVQSLVQTAPKGVVEDVFIWFQVHLIKGRPLQIWAEDIMNR